MLMRLNLDKVKHPIHCYYPASGKKYFDRLRYGTIYHETVKVIEHPISTAGIVENDGHFCIEAAFLDHGVENLGWRITEPDRRKFDPTQLKACGVYGPMVRQLQEKGELQVGDRLIRLDDVSTIRPGDSLAVVIDTRPCPEAIHLAKNAKILLAESTYLEEHADLAKAHYHLTAKEAALIAKEAGVEQLILTHFSARYLNSKDFENEAKKIFPHVAAADDLRVFPFPVNPPTA
jgi:ribonuclease Z